jgi:hypothetical protein
MATFAVFIHTLVFKNILTNKQGAMLYQAGYPYATRNTALILRTHTRACFGCLLWVWLWLWRWWRWLLQVYVLFLLDGLLHAHLEQS